jgi:predicted RND superfamily exporter protein
MIIGGDANYSDETGMSAGLVNLIQTLRTFLSLVTKDAFFAFYSLAFVFFYLYWHLSSLFLALIGIMIIIFSFPFTSVITNDLFGVRYFGFLHVLIVFVVLGIAADDIFVFYDGWRQSANIPMFRDNLEKRMAYSFRRAARAMAVTSATTSVAFMANISSPMLPIRAFGVFAGVIVPVNYLLVCMLFPPATILYEKYINGCFHNLCCLIFCFRKRKIAEVVNSGEQVFTDSEKFFRIYWNTGVKKMRWVIVVFTFAWFFFAANKARKIGPLTKNEEFIPMDHPIMIPINILNNNFTASDEDKQTVYFFFGIDDINYENTTLWNASYVGEPVMSPRFNATCFRC